MGQLVVGCPWLIVVCVQPHSGHVQWDYFEGILVRIPFLYFQLSLGANALYLGPLFTPSNASIAVKLTPIL